MGEGKINPNLALIKSDLHNFQVVQSPKVQQVMHFNAVDSPLSLSDNEDKDDEFETLKSNPSSNNNNDEFKQYQDFLNDQGIIPRSSQFNTLEESIIASESYTKAIPFFIAKHAKNHNKKAKHGLAHSQYHQHSSKNSNDSKNRKKQQKVNQVLQQEKPIQIQNKHKEQQFQPNLLDEIKREILLKKLKKNDIKILATNNDQNKSKVRQNMIFPAKNKRLEQKVKKVNLLTNNTPFEDLIAKHQALMKIQERSSMEDNNMTTKKQFQFYSHATHQSSTELEAFDSARHNLANQLQSTNSFKINIRSSIASINMQASVESLVHSPKINYNVLKRFSENIIITDSILQYLDIIDTYKLVTATSYNSDQETKLDLLQSYVNKQNAFDSAIEQYKQLWVLKFNLRGHCKNQKGYYQQFTKSKSKYDFEIEKDIERTFIDEECFNKGQPEYKKMFRILKAIALHDKELGYVQGFNFIVGNLLKIIRNEEQTFWMFIQLLEKYGFKDLYTEGMSKLRLLIFQVDSFIQNQMPEVDQYLTKKGIQSEYFLTQWLITFFSYDFGIELFAQVINLIIFEGPKIMIQICLAVVELLKPYILDQTMEQTLVFLKDFSSEIYLKNQEIMSKALEMDNVTQQLLKQLEQFYSKNKNKRVLFLKEQATGRIFIKKLPNLPDQEDEEHTECNVEENSGSESEGVDSNDFDRIVQNQRKKINNSQFVINPDNDNKGNENELQLIFQDSTAGGNYLSYRGDHRKSQHNNQEKTNALDNQIKQYQMYERQMSSPPVGQVKLSNKVLSTGLRLTHESQKYDQTTQRATSRFNQHGCKEEEFKQASARGPKEFKLDDLSENSVVQANMRASNINRVIVSPSFRQLQSPFSKLQQNLSPEEPQSENINDTEHKEIGLKSMRYQQNVKKLKLYSESENDENGIDNSRNYYQGFYNDTMNSQNMSDIEEFLSGPDINFNRLMKSQRLLEAAEPMSDRTERATMNRIFSNGKQNKNLLKDLIVQVDDIQDEKQQYQLIQSKERGQQKQTPCFNNNNAHKNNQKQTSILQEKSINHPLQSNHHFKKNALVWSQKSKIQENLDPNANYLTKSQNDKISYSKFQDLQNIQQMHNSKNQHHHPKVSNHRHQNIIYDPKKFYHFSTNDNFSGPDKQVCEKQDINFTQSWSPDAGESQLSSGEKTIVKQQQAIRPTTKQIYEAEKRQIK